MTAPSPYCAAPGCHRLLHPGDALLVTPLDGSAPFVVCRPSTGRPCIEAAGHSGQTRIALADVDAALEADRRRGGPVERIPYAGAQAEFEQGARRRGYGATTFGSRASCAPAAHGARGRVPDRPAAGTFPPPGGPDAT